MSIGKPKIMSIVSWLVAGLLLTNFAAAKKVTEAYPTDKPLGRQAAASEDNLILTARSRAETPEASGEFVVLYNRLEWNPSKTAIIICDMWDQHWCKGATRRVAELAPLMNEVIAGARDKGVLIIHAPSGTVEHYANHPARKRAQNAPIAANLPQDIAKSCKWIDEREEKTGYPIDHSDGGCDCQPKCEQGSPWRSQIDTLLIRDEDAISDSGVEIWNLLEQRGINNVILMGVHTNMCVLARPFGLRNMARYGKNVVLMRDLTDTMYNSRMHPFVSHFTGTDLIIEHIEKYICPTITSTVFTGRPQSACPEPACPEPACPEPACPESRTAGRSRTAVRRPQAEAGRSRTAVRRPQAEAGRFRFKDDKRPVVVFISAENEYDAAKTLPEFAQELETKYGLYCEILQGSTDIRDPGRHNIPGAEALTDANLAVVFARRRALPPEQMKYFRDYMDSGRPLIGLRTASHAFDARGEAPAGYLEWPKFDPEVLGGNYHGHYGRGPICTVTLAAGAEAHPILAGVQVPFTSNGSLYEVSPLTESTKPLLIGTIPDHEPEPVAWTNTYKKSRVFYTSLGHPDDFKNPQFRRLLVNAVFWAMDKPTPKVGIVIR